ncbi:unnamed protein product [Euphydryas editha]|uniref:Uncharacterized protein n=1 Tax=Euphydryas editha TaxID=104508 RepID=A0AAU9TIJ4_EUPED|nr:unnamed protein product [Euphydryas editha]
MAPPEEAKPLPARAKDVKDLKSMHIIITLAEHIQAAIKEKHSVTAINKKLISRPSEEIMTTIDTFLDLIAPTLRSPLQTLRLIPNRNNQISRLR